jgi:hypothetical protein
MVTRAVFCGIAAGAFSSFILLTPTPRQQEAAYRSPVSTVCEPYGNSGAELCQ